MAELPNVAPHSANIAKSTYNLDHRKFIPESSKKRQIQSVYQALQALHKPSVNTQQSKAMIALKKQRSYQLGSTVLA
jgi:hypothetical protein